RPGGARRARRGRRSPTPGVAAGPVVAVGTASTTAISARPRRNAPPRRRRSVAAAIRRAQKPTVDQRLGGPIGSARHQRYAVIGLIPWRRGWREEARDLVTPAGLPGGAGPGTQAVEQTGGRQARPRPARRRPGR